MSDDYEGYRVDEYEGLRSYIIEGAVVALTDKELNSNEWVSLKKTLLDEVTKVYDEILTQIEQEYRR